MIRAAAKNHEGVAVIVKPESYDAVCAELEESGGEVSASTRHWLANEAFAQTARYDAAISRWFSTSYEDFPEHLAVAYEKVLDLAYGENPHQRAALYSEAGVAQPRPLAGLEAARPGALLQQRARPRLGAAPGRRLRAEPACTIVKHNNPCGVAIGEDALDAYRKALACDPMSAFGGVIAFNRPVERRAGRGAARELRRGADRARLRGRRARGAAAEGGDPHPLRRGAAPAPTRASATSNGSSAGC